MSFLSRGNNARITNFSIITLLEHTVLWHRASSRVLWGRHLVHPQKARPVKSYSICPFVAGFLHSDLRALSGPFHRVPCWRTSFLLTAADGGLARRSSAHPAIGGWAWAASPFQTLRITLTRTRAHTIPLRPSTRPSWAAEAELLACVVVVFFVF